MANEHDGTGNPKGLIVPKALKAWLEWHFVAPQHLTTYSDPTTGRTMDPMRDSPALRGIVRQLVGMLWSAPERAPQPDAEPVEGDGLVEALIAVWSDDPDLQVGVPYRRMASQAAGVLRARVQPRRVSREAHGRATSYLRDELGYDSGYVQTLLEELYHELGLQIEEADDG